MSELSRFAVVAGLVFLSQVFIPLAPQYERKCATTYRPRSGNEFIPQGAQLSGGLRQALQRRAQLLPPAASTSCSALSLLDVGFNRLNPILRAQSLRILLGSTAKRADYDRHKGLDDVETRSSIINRVVNQISHDMSRASLVSGLAAIRGFSPANLGVAATGIVTSFWFKGPGFKSHLKREYVTKFSESGITSRQGVARVLKQAATSSDAGGASGAVLSSLGVAAAAYVGAAGASVTAPAWGPFALKGIGVIAASKYIGGALGYKHGIDSELEATAKRVYGDGPRRPARRQRKPEYRDKVRPRRVPLSP